MDKSNILMLCKKVPYPAMDGESIVIMSDIASLKSMGHSVYLFCINTQKHYVITKNYEKLAFWDGFYSTEINTNGFITLFKSFVSKSPLQLDRFHDYKSEKLIEKIIAEKQIKTLIYQGLAMTLYISDKEFISKFYRVHNLESTIWKRMAENSRNVIKKIFYNAIEKSLKKYEINLFERVDQFICLNPFDTDYYNQQKNESSRLISISIQTQYSKSYSSDNEGLLFIGSLDWEPNRQGLDWFLSKIYPSISHIPLTIAGKGNYDVKGLKNVKLVSNFDKIEELFSRHKLMIVPLLSGGGIRIKIMEAMKFGMPIISTEIGSEGIIDSRNSFINAESKSDWIDRILSIYSDKIDLNQKSKDMKMSYEEVYSIQKIRESWKSII